MSNYEVVERYLSEQEDLEDEAIERMNRALSESYYILEQKMREEYSDVLQSSSLIPSQRSKLLMAELSDLMPLISGGREEKIKNGVADVIGKGANSGSKLAQELLVSLSDDSYTPNSATLPIEAIADLANNAVKRLKNYDSEFQEKASQILMIGTSQGWGVQKTSSALKSQLGIFKSRAEKIVRTESISAMDAASIKTYLANGVKYIQRVATEDDRTCAYCLSRAGQIYPIGEAPAVIHPNDRCYNMPWVPGYQDDDLSTPEGIAAYKIGLLLNTNSIPSSVATSFEGSINRNKPEPINLFQAAENAAFYLTISTLQRYGVVDPLPKQDENNDSIYFILVAAFLAYKLSEKQESPELENPPPDPNGTIKHLLRNLGVGAIIAGVSIGAYYALVERYRSNLVDTAFTVPDLADDSFDVEDLGYSETIANEVENWSEEEKKGDPSLVKWAKRHRETHTEDYIENESKGVVFFVGGMGGQPTLDSFGITKYISMQEEFDGFVFYDTSNEDFNIDVGIDELRKQGQAEMATVVVGGQMFAQLLRKAVVEGKNPTAIRMAIQAYKFHKKHPDVPINLLGYSGGGMAAREAQILLKKIGVESKVVAIASPSFGIIRETDFEEGDSVSLTGDGDKTGTIGNSNPIHNKIVPGVSSHRFDSYVKSADFFPMLKKELRERNPPSPLEPNVSTEKEKSTDREAGTVSVKDLEDLNNIVNELTDPIINIDAITISIEYYEEDVRKLYLGKIKPSPLPDTQKALPMAKNPIKVLDSHKNRIIESVLKAYKKALLIPENLALPPSNRVTKISKLEDYIQSKIIEKIAEVTTKISNKYPAEDKIELIKDLKEGLNDKVVKELVIELPILLKKNRDAFPDEDVRNSLQESLKKEMSISLIKIIDDYAKQLKPSLNLAPSDFPEEEFIESPITAQERYTRKVQGYREDARSSRLRMLAELEELNRTSLPALEKRNKELDIIDEYLESNNLDYPELKPPGTSKYQRMHGIRYDRLNVYGDGYYKKGSKSSNLLLLLIKSDIPISIINSVSAIYITDQESSSKKYWSKVHGIPVKNINATSNLESGSIVLHKVRGARSALPDLTRQMGYIYAYKKWNDTKPPKESFFYKSAILDGYTYSTIAKSGIDHDFADSVRWFILDPAYLKKWSPNRYESIVEILGVDPLLKKKPKAKGVPTTEDGVKEEERINVDSPADDGKFRAILDNWMARQNSLQAERTVLANKIISIRDQKTKTVKYINISTRFSALVDAFASDIIESQSSLRKAKILLAQIDLAYLQLESALKDIFNPLKPAYFTSSKSDIAAIKGKIKKVQLLQNEINVMDFRLSKLIAKKAEYQVLVDEYANQVKSIKIKEECEKWADRVDVLLRDIDRGSRDIAFPGYVRAISTLKNKVEALRRSMPVPQEYFAQTVSKHLIDQSLSLEKEFKEIKQNAEIVLSRVNTIKTKLDSFPSNFSDLSEKDQILYKQRISVAVRQSKLPSRVQKYREMATEYYYYLFGQADKQGVVVNDFIESMDSIKKSLGFNIGGRIDKIEKYLKDLELMTGQEAVNWVASFDMERYTKVKGTDMNLEQAVQFRLYVTRVLMQKISAEIDQIEVYLKAPVTTSRELIKKLEFFQQFWYSVFDFNEKDSMTEVTSSPKKVSLFQIVQYGDSILRDIEEWNKEFNEMSEMPKELKEQQGAVYRRMHEAFKTEKAIYTAKIQGLASDMIEETKLQLERYKKEVGYPTLDINGVAYRYSEVKSLLTSFDERKKSYTIKIKTVDTQYELTNESIKMEQQLNEIAEKAEKIKEQIKAVSDRIGELNLEIKHKIYLRERGVTKGTKIDYLESQLKSAQEKLQLLLDESQNVSREYNSILSQWREQNEDSVSIVQWRSSGKE